MKIGTRRFFGSLVTNLRPDNIKNYYGGVEYEAHGIPDRIWCRAALDCCRQSNIHEYLNPGILTEKQDFTAPFLCVKFCKKSYQQVLTVRKVKEELARETTISRLPIS